METQDYGAWEDGNFSEQSHIQTKMKCKLIWDNPLWPFIVTQQNNTKVCADHHIIPINTAK